MARITTASHRILGLNHIETILIPGEPAMNIPDSVFGFLDEESGGRSSGGSNNSYNVGYSEIDLENEDDDEDDDDDLDREKPSNLENSKNFWETQNQLLQSTLCRTSSIESKVRNITKVVVKEAAAAEQMGNRSCLMKQICLRLQNAGFNSAICKSKWTTSPHIPSGEHTFLDVMDNSNAKKREVRVIIELNFRAEFEMARVSEEYNQLINKLPEIFVGKIERLLGLIKILCAAAKKCMKDKKLHIGPWRKQRYMQAKWVRICERTTTPATPLLNGILNRSVRPRARSMLTVDLLENLPNVHRTVVAVI